MLFQNLPGGSDKVNSSAFISKKGFNNLGQQLDERFARFEALLSCGDIFATPKIPVNISNPPVSQQPFIDPNVSVPDTGPVCPPTEPASKGSDLKAKESKKKHKSSHHKSSKSKPLPVDESAGLVQEAQTDTFPQTEPVPVVTKPLTSLEAAALSGEPVMGIYDST